MQHPQEPHSEKDDFRNTEMTEILIQSGKMELYPVIEAVALMHDFWMTRKVELSRIEIDNNDGTQLEPQVKLFINNMDSEILNFKATINPEVLETDVAGIAARLQALGPNQVRTILARLGPDEVNVNEASTRLQSWMDQLRNDATTDLWSIVQNYREQGFTAAIIDSANETLLHLNEMIDQLLVMTNVDKKSD